MHADCPWLAANVQRLVQGVHVALELAPETLLAVPALHGVQLALDMAPGETLYVPALHGVQLVLDTAPRAVL